MDILKNNEQGFTLIEILASVVILSIVLITFFGFYFQASLFSTKNDQKYTSHTLSQKVINLTQEKVTKDVLLDRGIIDSTFTVINGTFSTDDETYIENLLNYDAYDNDYTVRLTISNGVDELILVKVKAVSNLNTVDASETYTYIR